MDLFGDKIKKKQFLLTYAVFFANGLLALSIGSLLPFIREARNIDYAFGGLMVSLHSVGNLIAGFAAGALPMLIGKKRSILLFEIFFPISFLIILLANSNFLFAFAFFATGLARGACSNYCNSKINSIATGKAWALNALHAMFAIGAFLFPLILMVITREDKSRWLLACIFMVILGCITWVLYLLNPEVDPDKTDAVNDDTNNIKDSDINDSHKIDSLEDTKVSAIAEEKKLLGFLHEPLFYLCTLTLFFYLCAEQGVIGWMISYFKDTGLLNAGLSQITASVLWVMILCGRLTTAFFSTKVKKENLLPAMGVGIVIFFIILLFSRSTALIMLGIMGFGFSMAGIYATTVSFAGKLIKEFSLAWSFILTTASFGSILMPSIIGFIAEHAGIATGMASVAIALVIDMICIMSLVRYVKRNNI